MKKNKKSPALTQKVQILLQGVTIVVIVALTCVSAILWSQYNNLNASQKNDTSEIEAMIFSAIDEITRPLPVDAKSGDAYIRDASLMFPRSSSVSPNDFRFNYQPSSGDIPEQVTIAYSPMIEQEKSAMIGKQTFSEALDYVPNIQACARGYQFYFKVQDEHKDELVFKKALQDGRTVYVYKENACIEDNHDEIVNYLQQVDSY
ncbi:MAG TPA: hypothetical protein PKD15_01505 [Candidatus Saccharibacteria bacterium]|nr:hypothetical protein [Candidatus Saccharibacteria bacterium]